MGVVLAGTPDRERDEHRVDIIESERQRDALLTATKDVVQQVRYLSMVVAACTFALLVAIFATQ
jgi:hypothetical protein